MLSDSWVTEGLGLKSSGVVRVALPSSPSFCSLLITAGGVDIMATCVVFETRLLNAGQPLQPSAPPVPLQWPPPGQEPVASWPADT